MHYCFNIFLVITNLSLSGVEVNQLNTVVVSIHPVQNALGNVQTQAIRPQHGLAGQEYLVMRTIHPSFLYLPSVALGGVLLPVSPVHPSGKREEVSISVRAGAIKMLILNLMLFEGTAHKKKEYRYPKIP